MKKKSYNPFKMWGSYVGAGIFGGFSLYYGWFGFNQILNNWLLENSFNQDIFFLIIIGMTIVGFLIGWGIHSLVRYIRRLIRRRR